MKFLYRLVLRLRLIGRAILARPIIYGVKVRGSFMLSKSNRNVLIAKNVLDGGQVYTDR